MTESRFRSAMMGGFVPAGQYCSLPITARIVKDLLTEFMPSHATRLKKRLVSPNYLKWKAGHECQACSERPMKNGICPKCGSKDIRYNARRFGFHSHRNFLSAGFFSKPVAIQNYTCASCGYLESYVRTEDLRVVARKWAFPKNRRATPPIALE